MSKIKINMYSQATSVDGQGVGAAYIEQTKLIKEASDLFEMSINGKGSDYDICHFHTVNPTFYSKMHKKNINVAYVHFIPTTLDGSIKLPKGAFKIFKDYVISFYKKADEIVVVNPIFIKDLEKIGIPSDRVTYIPNFVNREDFHPISVEDINKVKDEFGIPKDKFIVLGVGQVQTRKGVVDFVDVAKKNPDIQFVWAGGFSFGAITDGYKELKAIMDNPPANVKFLGIIPRTRMNEFYNLADLLFMPSYNELFPMSILEAINSDKPVLLRNLELYEDILFHKYLVGSNNDEFSEIIQKLSKDKKYYEDASKYSTELAQFYSKEHVSNLWREYYPNLLKKYPNKGRQARKHKHEK